MQWRWSIGCITLTFIAFVIIPNLVNFLLKILIVFCIEEDDCQDEILFTMSTFTVLLPVVYLVSGIAFWIHIIPHIHDLQREDPTNPRLNRLNMFHWLNFFLWMPQPVLELYYQSRWDTWTLYHIFASMIFFSVYIITFVGVVTQIKIKS